jgi:hypothetical protein
MKNPSNNRSAVNSQVSQPSEEAMSANPIDHPSAETFRMKNFDTHHCITIKWSRDSASRRRFGLPPSAATGVAAAFVRPVPAGGAAWR